MLIESGSGYSNYRLNSQLLQVQNEQTTDKPINTLQMIYLAGLGATYKTFSFI